MIGVRPVLFLGGVGYVELTAFMFCGAIGACDATKNAEFLRVPCEALIVGSKVVRCSARTPGAGIVVKAFVCGVSALALEG